MKDYLFVIAGKGLSAAAQMIMLVLLAVALAPDRLSTVLAIYSLAVVIASLGDLGLGTLAMRERAYGDASKAGQVIRLGDQLAVLLAATGAASLLCVSIWFTQTLFCVPLLLWGPAERATESRMLILLAEKKSRVVATLSGLRRVAAAGLFLLLSQYLPSDLSFSVSLATMSLIVLFVTMRLAPAKKGNATLSRSTLLKEALPFTLTSVSGQMRNLDVPIVTLALGGSAAAAYGLGSRMASPVMLLFSAVSGLIMVRARGFSYRKLSLLSGALLSASTVAVAAIITFAYVIGDALTGYISWFDAEAVLIASVVASSYIFAGSGIIFGSLLVAFGLQSILARLSAITVVVALSCVALFSMNASSAIAASSASLACYSVQSILLAVFLLKAQKPIKGNLDEAANVQGIHSNRHLSSSGNA